ncbi:hypothetical protein MVES1_001143 [Malassezia vespertilionis]|uniref:uncharacterized protein n=1 Tax=Malassezia vespertilionis TaxID=2020962 RepID=UPI0024B22A8D|nr:uncharacterized protein MVES1_001143 [Malassezia vespertilionis]WFD05809.1 hypothetical protein MVES1_001143 [Malassezia vespertilionis]
MEPVLGAPGHTSLFFNSSFASDSSDGSAAASSAGPSRLQHLATSFHLHDAEIAFFDQVLRGLDDTSSSFSELKHMYNACIQDTSLVTQVARTLELTASYRVADIRAAVDTRLWNTLLSLVQVRGSTWRERWDSVRVSIGLEPLDTPDTEEPYAMNTLADALAFADPETSTADLDSVWHPPSASVGIGLPPWQSKSWYTDDAEESRARMHDPDMVLYRDALLRRFLHTWRRRIAASAHTLRRVGRAQEKLVKLHAWIQWRRRAARAQQQRALATQAWRGLLLHRAWNAWIARIRMQSMSRRANQRATLRALFFKVDARRAQTLRCVAWTLWQHAWDRRIAQRCYNVQILRAAWAQWREQTAYRHMEQRQERHADAFDAALVRERAWRAWRRTFARCCALERTASKAHSARAHEHVALTFTEWRLHAKAQFIDRVCRAQALRTAWNQWWQAFTTRTVQMQCAERDAASLDRTRRLSDTLAQWRRMLRYWAQRAILAQKCHNVQRAAAVWDAWRTALANERARTAHASQLRLQHLQRRIFYQWKRRHHLQVAQRMQRKVQHKLCGNALHTRQRHMAARRAEHSADVLLLTRAVAQWRTRYEVNVHMDQKAAATHTLHLLGTLLSAY